LNPLIRRKTKDRKENSRKKQKEKKLGLLVSSFNVKKKKNQR
jgi:hypothetical protein